MINDVTPALKDAPVTIPEVSPQPSATKKADVAAICSPGAGDVPVKPVARPPYTSPLHRYTLLGRGNELADDAVEKTPVLGNVCLRGDVTLWGAPPNSGKTLFAIGLLADAVMNKAIDPGRAFYLNMDDSMTGVAEKVTILQDYGVHVLAEGYRGFTASKVPALLETMIADQTARDAFVIVDTLKKVVDPMDKRKTVEFMKLARRFSLAGGSLLLLAHTNKQRGGDGKLVLAGVADLRDDCDTAYLLDRRVENDLQQVVFENVKRRGGGASTSVYTCSADPEIGYVDRLLSVRFAGVDPAHDETAPDAKVDDDGIIQAIEMTIRHGTVKKMAVIDVVRRATKASRRIVKDVLERHTGADPAIHLWDYSVQAAGANVYRLHALIEQPTAG